MSNNIPATVFNSLENQALWSLLHFSESQNALFLYFFFFFRATLVAYGSCQARGQSGAVAASLHHSHSNARSLTHWVRPGIETATSWFLVRFVSTAPRWELQDLCFTKVVLVAFRRTNFKVGKRQWGDYLRGNFLSFQGMLASDEGLVSGSGSKGV